MFCYQDDMVAFGGKEIQEVKVDDDRNEAEELKSVTTSEFLGGGSGIVTSETDDDDDIISKKETSTHTRTQERKTCNKYLFIVINKCK